MSQTSSQTSANTAIESCCSVWQSVYKAQIAKGKNDVYASRDAAQAYRSAMPPLSGQENIGDFIACVAKRKKIGAIEGSNGTKLLYAAQVALSTIRRQPTQNSPEAA